MATRLAFSGSAPESETVVTLAAFTSISTGVLLRNERAMGSSRSGLETSHFPCTMSLASWNVSAFILLINVYAKIPARHP